MTKKRDLSDLTDAEWQAIEPLTLLPHNWRSAGEIAEDLRVACRRRSRSAA